MTRERRLLRLYELVVCCDVTCEGEVQPLARLSSPMHGSQQPAPGRATISQGRPAGLASRRRATAMRAQQQERAASSAAHSICLHTHG
eukprot:COSAG01_NODE_13764_length_1538_cov_2.428075_3_plen_88_part_00